MTNDATRATAEAMPQINRRRFLINTASAGAAIAVAVPVHAAEPDITPRQQAIWHMHELDRLAREDGALSSAVMLVGAYEESAALFTLGHDGNLTDAGGMFTSKGGAA